MNDNRFFWRFISFNIPAFLCAAEGMGTLCRFKHNECIIE
jgi:hypothetical protein